MSLHLAVVTLVAVAYVNLASTEEGMGLCYICPQQNLENNEGSAFAWVKSFLKEINSRCPGLKTRRRNTTPRTTTGPITDRQRTTTDSATMTTNPQTSTIKPPATTTDLTSTVTESPTTTNNPSTTTTEPPTTTTVSESPTATTGQSTTTTDPQNTPTAPATSSLNTPTQTEAQPAMTTDPPTTTTESPTTTNNPSTTTTDPPTTTTNTLQTTITDPPTTTTNTLQTTPTDPPTTPTDPPTTPTEPPTTTTEPPTTTTYTLQTTPTDPPTTTTDTLQTTPNDPPTTTTNSMQTTTTVPPTTTTNSLQTTPNDPPTTTTNSMQTTTTDPPTTTTNSLQTTTTDPPTTPTDFGPADCQALLDAGHTVSGVYNITPAQYPDGLEVYCDMTTDSKGWIVCQRRVDGTVNFTRSWAKYRDGFGDTEGEFWLGNEILRRLTEALNGTQKWEMRVDLVIRRTSPGNNEHSGVYDDFHVDGENYTLHVGAFTDQTYLGDALSPTNEPPSNGQPFSTYDRDNDAEPSLNCADELKGGWWFNRCTLQYEDSTGPHSNLNGEYSQTSDSSLYGRGIVWSNVNEITRSEMKMRRLL